MQHIHSFTPIIDQDSRVLILGSMPGKISLEKEQYYAHPLNKFWTFIYSVFNLQPDLTYEAKTFFLKSRHIALWDVIEDCERYGSSDSKIINPVINDVAGLLARYPNIKSILFNGKKAEKLFNQNLKNIPACGIKLNTLPSSSPANARINWDQKMAEWKVVKDLVKK
jgi:hypoxanthine-DNA glycosylase